MFNRLEMRQLRGKSLRRLDCKFPFKQIMKMTILHTVQRNPNNYFRFFVFFADDFDGVLVAGDTTDSLSLSV